jgi:DNA-binding transcriptional MerR regulator
VAPVNGIHAAMSKTGVTAVTTKDVAAAVGVSPDTITRWRRAGLVKPATQTFGKTFVYLFTEADIEICKRLHLEIKPGRKADGDKSVRVSHTRQQRLARNPNNSTVKRSNALKRKRIANLEAKRIAQAPIPETGLRPEA